MTQTQNTSLDCAREILAYVAVFADAMQAQMDSPRWIYRVPSVSLTSILLYTYEMHVLESY